MKKFAVIVAGGSGLRMGTSVPKQFLKIGGNPVLYYTITTFLQAFADLQVILVLPPDTNQLAEDLLSSIPEMHRVTVTSGGETRFESVKNGLDLIQQHSVVFIHDGVRCLLSKQLIHRCYEAVLQHGNAIPAIPAVDSIRIQHATANQVIDRNKVRIIQTPQTFFSDLVKAAFGQDYEDSFTDEASVVEKLGVKIHLVEGESTNIKITRPIDLVIAEKILEEREMG